MKVGDKVKVIKCEDNELRHYVGLTGTIVKVLPDEGNVDLSVIVRFDLHAIRGLWAIRNPIPKKDAFYPEELSVL